MQSGVPGRWVALARASGSFDPRPLRAEFADREALERAPTVALRQLGVPGRVVESLGCTPTARPLGAWVTVLDPEYPEALLELDRPPPVLWWQGDWGVLERPRVAVVGSRACTPYGRLTAGQLGRGLGQAGVLVVSGAARGVDEHAHRGALGTPGGTVAVLGAGLGQSCSAEGNRLRQEILAGGGLVLTELPPSDPATVWTFPRRNRIIAALGQTTVVVEAAKRSGALITAREATALGRDVVAVPGRWDMPSCAGTLGLIAEGAQVMIHPDALVASLAPPPTGPAARLLGALAQPCTADELGARLGMPVREVLGLLVALELQGRIIRSPDQRYALVG